MLVGCGRIGERHLQGILKLKNKINLNIIEKNKKTLQKIKKKYSKYKTRKNLNSITFNYKNIKKKIHKTDLVILSTTSKNRLQLIKKLCSENIIRNFLIEKVVFQDELSFNECLKIFKKQNIKAWVNTPCRIYPDYLELKKRVKDSRIKMSVKGSNINIGSNLIHYLDLFLFLTSSKNIFLEKNFLHRKIYKSKRKGFVEFGGTLIFSTRKMDKFFINDERDGFEASKINIGFDKKKILIDESSNIATYFNSQKIKKIKFQIPYQSDLTNKIAESIFEGSCKLPSLNVSSLIHKLMIRVFRNTVNENLKSKKSKFIKIT